MQTAASPRSSYTPPLAALRGKTTKCEAKFLDINCRGNIAPIQRLKTKRPKLTRKNKGGAPKGNRNALTTGFHTAPARALRARIFRFLTKVRLDMALVKMERAEAKARDALLKQQSAICEVGR